MRSRIVVPAMVTLTLAAVAPAFAATTSSQASSTPPAGTQAGRMMYGYQLMTPAERAAYRAHMRSLKTPQERHAFRLQHHREMRKRADARGITLPDMPMHGMGRGRNMGRGQGMGPGMMRSSPPPNAAPAGAGTAGKGG